MSSATTITPQTLDAWLADGHELALIDVREEGQFGQAHLIQSSNLPYSQLETGVAALLPRPSTRVVLIGDDEASADAIPTLAAARLAALGYHDVHLLQGGIAQWRALGRPLLPSIHVPSKAFAEYVEHFYHTPAVTPGQLQALRDSGADVIVLDGRTEEEFRRFHVPGAISCPNAELVLRFQQLVPSPTTQVIVSCAGRTRGIIGAQALINAGVPNPVAALGGGTQSWKLAGFAVESGPSPVGLDSAPPALETGRQRARALADRYRIARIDAAQLTAWRADPARTTYVFDVRTPDEYRAGHLPGAVGVPGGQLIQTLDKWAAVRGARIVLVDDLEARADVTAHWLWQLGWEVAVLDRPDAATFTDRGAAITPATASTADLPVPIDPAEARSLLAAGAATVSVASSADFARARIAGATWTNRARLHALPDALGGAPVLLVFGDAHQAHRLAARDLALHRPGQRVIPVDGDVEAWQAAGLPVETSAAPVPDEQRIDFLFWLHDRHTGNADASRAYLEWEGSLPATLGSPDQAGFRIRSSA